MATTTIAALKKKHNRRGNVRKGLNAVAFLAPTTVDLPDALTDAGGQLKELPAGWLPVGLLTKDGLTPPPPHAQGWQLAGLVGGGGDASTPTYAGLARSVCASSGWTSLYPRIHGADASRLPQAPSIVPLPPHARG